MNKQRVGIWGLGAVGTSAVRFFNRQGNPIEVLNVQTLNDAILHILPTATHYIQQNDEKCIHDFFKRNDIVIASPGINTTPYIQYAHKFVTELDVLFAATNTPLIGITGTVGKTTITTVLSVLLQKLGYAIGTGGNIGIPMLDLIAEPKAYDYFVLELSSFQLEYTKKCAPYLAIWTNFYQNHLDRHRNVTDYFLAKLKIMAHQTAAQHTLLPLALIPILNQHGYTLENIASELSCFTLHEPTTQETQHLSKQAQIFFIKNNHIMLQKNTRILPLINCNAITLKTYPENLLILTAALYCLQQPLDALVGFSETPSFEDRLEYVATHNNITFYNDSKATIMQATHAAIDALAGNTIILLLGGLSKGVDRKQDIQRLAGKVKYIICFGKEAALLHEACLFAEIPCNKTNTLENAFELAINNAHNKDTILLSPGGASFDLFLNYKERGKKFKELVAKYRHDKTK